MRCRERPQNLDPAALIRARKQVAAGHADAVHMTIRAMKLRGVAREKITVKAVAHESGVSVATMYRRDDLLAIVMRVNPAVSRRPSHQEQQADMARLIAEHTAAVEDSQHFREELRLLTLGQKREQIEVRRDRKDLLRVQQENYRLNERLANCTCGIHLVTSNEPAK